MDSRPSVIVTGSSAGGIDALLAFVPSLPVDLPAPIVVAQHLDPRRSSRLQEILAQHCPLPVQEIVDRCALQNGHVYVAPPNRDVSIMDGAVQAVDNSRVGAKPSIDRLFTSAAEAYEDRTIAIIFSGAGSDGLAGARSIKERGGTIIVQDSGTAVHPSMPRSIPPNLTDLVAPPEELGMLLGELMRDSTAPVSADEERAVHALLMQLREHTGIDFLQYKMPTIMRRLMRLTIVAGKSSIDDYLTYVSTNPDEYQHLVAAFLLNVTEFFRDGSLFDALQNEVLPRLIEDAAREQRDLRIWSAGCSTGEEAYSVAILCAVILKEIKSPINVRIFATDLDEQALTFARRGIYGAESVRQVPLDWLRQYFVKIDDSYEISKQVRAMIVFGQHDLVRRAPFPHTDLCLCRNVLMYFTRPLQMQVLSIFAYSLREGGYLVLGKAETATPMERYFRVTDGTLKIYRRYGEPAHIPNLPISQMGLTAETSERARQAAATSPHVPQRLPAPNSEVGISIARLPLGFLLVNRQYDILSLNAAARSLLDIRTVGLGEDLIHQARAVASNDLRDVVDAAFRGEQTGPHSLRGTDPVSGGERWLEITVYPDPGTANVVDRVALLITDVSAAIGERLALEKRTTEQSGEIGTLTQRLKDLEQRQRTLLEANDELATTNAELRGKIQELNVHAEAAAAANEEVAVLNEEMQATNEQLETLNEELHATNEELNTTNNELQRRGLELETMAKSYDERFSQLQEQRELLGAVLDSEVSPIAILRDEDGVIYASASVAEWIPTQPGDWWKGKDPVVVGGKKYTLASSEIAHDAEPYRMVSFTPAH